MSPEYTAHQIADIILTNINSGLGMLSEAARLYHNVITEDPAMKPTIDNLLGKDPAWLERLDKIGAGKMCVEMLYVTEDIAKIVGSMPMKEQKKLVRDGVPVVTAKGTVQNVSLAKLNHVQKSVAFSGGVLRSVSEQKITQAKIQEAKASVSSTRPYVINGRSLSIDIMRNGHVFCRIPLVELESAVRELRTLKIKTQG